jgi:hypothetical protein
MKDVAVVILNYNGRHFLEQFLPNLVAHSGEAQLIVADNASTDDSMTFMQQWYPNIRLIQFELNHGFAGGYNQALSLVDASYFAIINSDVEVSEEWLSPLVQFLNDHSEYAAVQPKIRSFHERGDFEYAGAAGGFVDTLGYPYCRGRLFDTLEKDLGQYDNNIDIDWASGACMLIRSEVFHSIGGFDAHFFAHMEEIDLCWRMRSAGWKLACIPNSVVYHVGGGTLHKSSPRKTFLNFKNGLSLLVKNLPLSQLLWKLPVRLILDGIAALKFALESSPMHLVGVLKAHWAFYGGFFRDVRKRHHTSSPRHINVVINYFIKKKRKFSELNQ